MHYLLMLTFFAPKFLLPNGEWSTQALYKRIIEDQVFITYHDNGIGWSDTEMMSPMDRRLVRDLLYKIEKDKADQMSKQMSGLT